MNRHSFELDAEMNAVKNTIDDLAKRCDLDVKKDEFVIVQPYSEHEAITLIVFNGEDGQRTVEVKVNTATIILPKKDGKLSIFHGGEN